MIVTRAHDRGFLTVVTTGDLYELTPTAILLVEALRAPVSAEELVASLARAYPDVGSQTLRDDVLSLLATLQEAGAVETA